MPVEKPILLVEDNPDDVELTRLAFQKTEIANEVIVASDGVEALEVLFGRAGEPGRAAEVEVVLLDLKLPRIDGLEVLRRIRADERTKHLPVVILTSSAEEQDMRRGYGLGANSYVRKPLDFGEFLEAARALGRYWLGLNRRPSSPAS